MLITEKDNLFSLPDVDRQAMLYAEYVKRAGLKTLRFWPLKKTAGAHANKTRRRVLEQLTGIDGGDSSFGLYKLEEYAKQYGYKIEAVDPADWS